MDAQQFENKGLRPGARVLIQLDSRIVRAGIFLGQGDSPVDPQRGGLFLAIEPERRVVEWIELGYVGDISVAIPPDA